MKVLCWYRDIHGSLTTKVIESRSTETLEVDLHKQLKDDNSKSLHPIPPEEFSKRVRDISVFKYIPASGKKFYTEQ
jgi:hypothetical protein